MELDPINDIGNPITDETFIKQGWEKHIEQGEEGDSFYYWVLPLPKDNPDKNAPHLVSSLSDEWEYLGIPKGTYRVYLGDYFGLGVCECEEEIEDLYVVLCAEELMGGDDETDSA